MLGLTIAFIWEKYSLRKENRFPLGLLRGQSVGLQFLETMELSIGRVCLGLMGIALGLISGNILKEIIIHHKSTSSANGIPPTLNT